MIDFLRNLLGTMPVLAALLLVAAANVPRRDRVRQSVVPIVAILYAAVSLYLLYRFNDAIDSALRGLASALPGDNPPLGVTLLYIGENVAALLVFVLVKLVVRPLSVLLFTRGREIAQVLVSGIYEYSPDHGLWFIGRRFSSLRLFYRGLYWASIAATLLLIASALTFPDWPGFAAVAFPAIAAMVIGEFYFAIDGVTEQEHDQSITGERDSSRRVANYGPLRKVYQELFPERILADGVQLSSNASVDSRHRLNRMAESPDELEQLAGAYFARLNDGRVDVDVNLAEASLALLRGRSVLIGNPFYADLTPYLALPAYFHLLQYRKCLVIAGRDSAAEDLERWIKEGLEKITGVPGLWNVEMLSELGRDDLDVGILRSADLHNVELLRSNEAFLGEVAYVILADPSRMLATGQLGLGLVVSMCSRGTPPAFAAFDGNHDGLVDALSHLLKLSLTEVVASTLPRGSSTEVAWRVEGPSMHPAILPAVSRYLGGGTELAAVALKYHVGRVHWAGSDAFPVTDMMWIAGQYYGQINAFADLELSQDVFRDSIVALPNPWGMPQAERYFLVVEDEASNVFETSRQFLTRAVSTGFVNVLTEDYLLRDYMVGNRELFTADAKAVPSIVPDFARTERNAVLRLILAMSASEVHEDDVAREFELVGWAVPRSADVEAVDEWESRMALELRRVIVEHTGVRDVTLKVTERFTGEGGSPEAYLSLAGGQDLDAVVDSLRAAYFFVEDEREDVNRIGSLLFGHVYQAMLPGQFLTYGGRYYEVQRISDAAHHHGVVLRRAADHIRDRRAYRQLRTFRVSSLRPTTTTGARTVVGKVELIRSVATVEAHSEGFLELGSRADLATARKVLVSDVPVREYRNKAILELRLPEVPPRVRKTVALLLNELFVTVFPYAHHYVVAVTPDHEGEFGDLLSGLEIDQADDSILIVEDSMIDLGLIVAVERNWERLLETITEYLAWNATPLPEPDTEQASDFVPEFPDLPERAEYVPRQRWWHRIIRVLRRRRPAVLADPADPAPVQGAEAGLPQAPEASVAPETPEALETPEAPVAQEALVAQEELETPQADEEGRSHGTQ